MNFIILQLNIYLVLIVTTYSLFYTKNSNFFFKQNNINLFKINQFFLIPIIVYTVVSVLYIHELENTQFLCTYTGFFIIIFLLMCRKILIYQITVILVLQTLFELRIFIENIAEFIILIELFNIVIVFLIINDFGVKLNFKKNIYIYLIILNAIATTSFIVLYIWLNILYKTTNIRVLTIALLFDTNINILVNFIIFVKLGVLIGPQLTQYVYINTSKTCLFVYIYFYYLVLPVLVLPLFNMILFNYKITTSLILYGFITLIIQNKEFYSIKNLIFLSGQINLMYLQLFI